MDCVAFDLSDSLPNFWSKQFKKREQRSFEKNLHYERNRYICLPARLIQLCFWLGAEC